MYGIKLFVPLAVEETVGTHWASYDGWENQ